VRIIGAEEVSSAVFRDLVESYLSRNYRLYLIVEGLPEKKEIGCSGQYCTEILTVAPPDDTYINISLDKPKEGDFKEREYKCSKGHVTKVYWYPTRHYAVVTRSR
jgi:hypothetical protein